MNEEGWRRSETGSTKEEFMEEMSEVWETSRMFQYCLVYFPPLKALTSRHSPTTIATAIICPVLLWSLTRRC